MDHEFDLAFELLDDAIDRLRRQHYGTTVTTGCHNHGADLLLTSRHTYSSTTGHTLTLLATYKDSGEVAAAAEITTPDLHTKPQLRVTKIAAADLMFHHIPGTWSWRATGAAHTYTITAGIGAEPLWTLTADHSTPVASDNIGVLVEDILAAEAAA